MLFGVGPTLDHLVGHLGRLSYKQRTLGSAICIQHHQRKHHPYQTFTHHLNTELYTLFLYFMDREHATQLFTWESWWMTGRLPFAARVLAAFRIAKFIHNLIPPIDRDQMWPVKLRLLNFAITLRLHSTALMNQNILNRVNLNNLKIGCLSLIPWRGIGDAFSTTCILVMKLVQCWIDERRNEGVHGRKIINIYSKTVELWYK